MTPNRTGIPGTFESPLALVAWPWRVIELRLPVCVAAAIIVACDDASTRDANETASLIEEIRLDAGKEDFSTLGRVAVNQAGKIAVFLPQDAQVRIYDSGGTRLASFGRRGQGPGEFLTMPAGGWIADTVWIYDGAERRVTYFGPGGSLLRTVSVATNPRIDDRILEFFRPHVTLRNGAMLGVGRFESTAATGVSSLSTPAVVRIDADGGGAVIATGQSPADDPSRMEIAGFNRSVPFMLAPTTVMSPAGDRIASLSARLTSAESGEYTISLLRSTGDTVFHRTYDFTGVAIPDRAVDSALASFLPKEGAPSEGPSNLAVRFQTLARERMPRVYTPVQSIMLGMDGTIWVGMRPDSSGARFLILDEHGDQIGAVLLPPRSRILQAATNRLWLAVQDHDGLASVVRYRVTGHSPGRDSPGIRRLDSSAPTPYRSRM